MGLPNKDEMKGKFDKAKGSVKENVGRTVDDEEMEQEGKRDRAKGDLREGYGEARRKIGEKIEETGKKIRR